MTPHMVCRLAPILFSITQMRRPLTAMAVCTAWACGVVWGADAFQRGCQGRVLSGVLFRRYALRLFGALRAGPPKAGQKMAFSLLVFDRDRADRDEWK